MATGSQAVTVVLLLGVLLLGHQRHPLMLMLQVSSLPQHALLLPLTRPHPPPLRYDGPPQS